MKERYDASEQDAILATFSEMLSAVTRDGGRKRAAGKKLPWWRDLSHEAAIFSHLNRWKHYEKADPDSGVHPLVHLAWRALAIAYQETVGLVPPQVDDAPDTIMVDSRDHAHCFGVWADWSDCAGRHYAQPEPDCD